jgi:hypothetical protein
MRYSFFQNGLIFSAVMLAVHTGGPFALAQPLTTAFSYQGELQTAGAPASGVHDLRFRLYDAATGDGLVGTELCSDNVTVTDGRFTVALDFGAVFTGQQRFLEIEVRADTGLDCSNPTGFTILNPRQPLTAAPNAAFALNAADAVTATTATNATQLNGQAASFYQNAANLSSGTLPGARLGGTYSNSLILNNASNLLTGSFTGSGAGITGLNASNLAAGTLPSGRLSGTYSGALTLNNAANAFTGTFTGTGAGLTGLNASNIASGTLSDARLSTNVAFLAGPQSFTGAKTFSTAPAFSSVGTPFSVSATGLVTNLNADLLDGLHASAFLRSVPIPLSLTGFVTAGAIITGSNSSITSGSGVLGLATAATGITQGVRGESASTGGSGVFGRATATTGSTTGVSGQTDSTSGTGVFGLATAGSGTTFGVHGQADSLSGRGVFGEATAVNGTTFGVRGTSNSTSGRGVYGEATAGTGITFGVHGQSDSSSGNGVFGEATAASGFTYGVWGESAAATGGRGVFGWATGATGTTNGVRGISESTSGRGVFGWATSATGTTYGVLGESDSSSASAFGVFAEGRSGATGSKSFRIDHPADPENKYLYHYSTESPEVLNAYSGKVALDNAGEAVVELPAYFARINKDPRYTLTAVGAPMPLLHVAEEIDEGSLLAGEKAAPGDAVPACSFRIAGGAPGAKVSWRIEAVRNDLWMRNQAAPVEADKEGLETGTYQHPEFYGQPKERGMGYSPERDAASAVERGPAPR